MQNNMPQTEFIHGMSDCGLLCLATNITSTEGFSTEIQQLPK